MIIIGSTGSTIVTTTLYENSVAYSFNNDGTLNPTYFTWNLQKKGSLDNISFYQNDISTNPFYYNQFNLTLATSSATASIGLTQGLFYAIPGEYQYTIYEQSQPYIIATSSAIKVVEVGIFIIGTTFSSIATYQGVDNNVIPVYRM